MNFKELFKKYKNNTATEEETKIVEAELEKHQLINDFYTEQDELDFGDDMINSDFKSVEVKSIKKAVRRRNLLLVSISTGCVLFLLIIGNFVLNPLLNQLFYNPDTHTYSERYNDLSIGMSTYDSLHSPGLDHHAIIENTGIGTYDITIQEYSTGLNGGATLISAKLNKGKVEMNNYFNTFPTVRPFGVTKWSEGNIGIEGLKKLAPSIRIEAYLTFSKPLTLDQLIEIYTTYSGYELSLSWASVDQNLIPKTTPTQPVIGFNPSGGGNGVFEEINNYYPDYNFDEQLKDSSLFRQEIENTRPTIELYESHFKTLIQYQLDHLDYLKAFDPSFDYEKYYNEILDMVDESGIKINGIVVEGFVESISQITKDYQVNELVINGINLTDLPYK